jgi:uncharacterized protein YhaN
MRIERIRVDCFGRLRDLDTGPEALPGLVVVLGPNEAGKSTLFHFLTSMLYGFQPATRERNPYAPWDGGDPSGAIGIQLDGGGCVDVERRLLSQPSARMDTDQGAEELRNRALPWVAHIPRAVFRQLYALTLAELAALEEDTWGQVQDRLIGSMGASDLRGVRQVVAELEQEAGELWRPTRRGNQRIRDIQEELLALRAKRRDALHRDRRLRDVVREVADLRDRLRDAREERQRARITVHRIQELAPVRRQLQRIRALEEEAGDPQSLMGLPADPAASVAELKGKKRALLRRLAELDPEREVPAAAIAAVGPREEATLAAADPIAALGAQVAGLGSERARLASVEQEIRDIDRRLDSAAARLVADPEGDVLDRLAAVPVARVRERVRRTREATDERRIFEAARERRQRGRGPESYPVFAGVLGLLVGVVLIVMGLAFDSPPTTTVGGVTSMFGLLVLLSRLSTRRGGDGAGSGGDEAVLGRLRNEEEQAKDAVLALFGDLDLPPSALAELDGVVLTDLERIQDLTRDRAERTRVAEALASAAHQVDEAASGLASALGLAGELDADSTARRLESELRRAERLHETAAAATRELARLDRESLRLRAELEEVQEALDELRGRVSGAGEADSREGWDRLRQRLEAWHRARQLREELVRTHPDLAELQERIREAEEAGESWTLDDSSLAAQQAREEELSEDVERLAAQAEALERDAAHLREAETADFIDGEIASLQETEAALLRERDRRWVLAHLLRQADHRFREEHQPDLMRRAGAHLDRLTSGRYTRVTVDDVGDGSRFLLVGPDLPGPIPLAPPISTGTLEQAYLSLRLAIVDHLDQGMERLPLFVDELFVNWDERRRDRGLDILKALSRERQLFTFTCHAHIARDLESGGARVLVLDADR